MGNRLVIDASYCERITLDSGDRVCLRLIRPGDKSALLRAFAELSAPSRRKRFFGAKQSLSESELSYFTETDGWDHIALAAVSLQADGSEGAGLGIARAIRRAQDPGGAEVAITVIDRAQGQGIGRALLERLMIAARERGITRFRFECLTYNQEIQWLVKRVCRVVESHYDREILIVEADLAEESAASPATPREHSPDLFTLLRSLAIQSIRLQMDLNRSALQRSLQAGLDGFRLIRRIRRPAPFRIP